MVVYQMLVTIVRGDAIGNSACMTGEVIKGLGFQTQIYAENCGPGFPRGFVLPVDQMPNPEKEDVVIYHMCECSKINQMLPRWDCKKVAVYHNTTPPEFFHGFSDETEQRLYQSQREIARLKNCFDRVIADSEFNKENLIRMGYPPEKIAVVPIILDFEDYFQPPDQKTLRKYSDGCTNLLFVGRVAPNKKFEDIIRIFAYYKKTYDTTARLILVGSAFTQKYMDYLNAYIKEIGMEDVVFPGHISFPEILSFYSLADVFLCMSEHEGFCVPLLEAMLFDIPIIAYRSTAIPGTLGESGILSDTKDPVFIAALIDRIRNDQRFRSSIVEGQARRLKDFDKKKSIQRFSEELQSLICEGGK